MADTPKKNDASPDAADLAAVVETKTARKLKARRGKFSQIWFGFSVFGLIGWSVAVPALLGVGLGLWLDDNYPRQQSWTLALLLAGLSLGCYNAWRWLEKERRDIGKTKEESDD